MIINDIINKLNKVLDINACGGAKPKLPPLTILASQNRAGMSALKTANAVLDKKRELGLPTGNYEDGTANYDDIIIYEIVKQIQKSIREDANIQVVIPAGIPVQASGANAGGPVVVVGATTFTSSGGGIVS
jgi:hypothetical protein